MVNIIPKLKDPFCVLIKFILVDSFGGVIAGLHTADITIKPKETLVTIK
jgi:hypothetical protein